MRKKTINYLMIITICMMLTFLVGCVKDAKETVRNGDYTVEFLFEQNGCKMYRFKDGTRYVYWTDCSGKAQYNYNTQSGSTSVENNMETITTE